MPSPAPTRFAAALSLACASLLLPAAPATAQARPSPASQPSSSLPATLPTVQSQPPLTAAQQEPKHAQVSFSNGMLSVSADNSSLNQILRQISRETGMTVTGGVTDERVFGKYGPAAPSQILATLLDGTGSNMLLMHRDGSTPAELVLTPRTGGPTPPNPNAAIFNEQSEPEETHEREETQAPSLHPGQSRAPTQSTPVTALSPDAAASSNQAQPQSPNGVKTPQQIYEQLQRIRQQTQTQPQ